MMHGHEKSRSAIVAVKPTNKAERSAAEPVERRAETKGNVDQQRTRRTQSRISVSQLLARIRHIVAVDTRGGSRMRESCTYGSVRGARGNSRPYRDRRDFISLLGGVAAWPVAARAQQPERMRRVGVLVNNVETDPEVQEQIAAFRRSLEQLGWVEGRNIHIELRFSSNNYARVPELAQEMVALNPAVIFANTTPAVKALQVKTRTIPIVFVYVSDPVGAGLVTSLARPGGNITGLLLYEDSITGKWLGMLKEISPRLTRTALVANPKGFTYDYFLRSSKAIAPALGIELTPAPIENDAANIEQRIEAFARVPDGGLFVPPDTTTVQHRDLIIALAARYRLPAVYAFRYFATAGGLMSYSTDMLEQHRQASLAARYRLPAVYPFRFFAEVGGLLSYGVDQTDNFRRAATYVDRILKGAKPSELPVQAPVKFELVINLKTAKTLGLTVPQTLLVAADELIE
jgi:putative tryptophan/tyrosine transport system substrate-binding protein